MPDGCGGVSGSPAGAGVDGDTDAFGGFLGRLLKAVRTHLDLEVAFIGEVEDGRRRVAFVDAAPGVDVVPAGSSDPLEESYCGHILAGRLPELLVDATAHPVSAELEATAAIPVGTHVGVRIGMPGGRTYGTLCCFARQVRPSLDSQALGAVRVVAELAAEHLEAMERRHQAGQERREEIAALVADPAGLELRYQPLVDLDTMEVVAVEALARFPGRDMSPAHVFAEAAECGLGVELEMKAVRGALMDLDRIPRPLRLNINVSPETLYAEEFIDAVSDASPDRLVVEVTEHAVVDDYTEMRNASRCLADRGIRLAIDDVGMGFSGLNRILETEPTELKLDAAVIRDVHLNPVKQALIETFCAFGRRAGFEVVAEGIETDDELDALRVLGAPLGQGFYLWRPAPLADIVGIL